jgi:hypothetical protein
MPGTREEEQRGNREQEERREKEAQRPGEGRTEQLGGGEHGGQQDQERPVDRPQRERVRRRPKKVEST